MARRMTNLLFLHNSHLYFAISSCRQRVITSRNIFRTVYFCTMKDLPPDPSETLAARVTTTDQPREVDLVDEENHGSSPREVSSAEIEEIETRWKRKFLDTTYCGEAIFVLGPMGVGKTTVIENELKSHSVYSNYAYVDTDEIMGMLKGFASNRVEEYYPIARGISIRLTDWILDRRISFVAEGTCVKSLELIDYMHRLKTGGYLIRVKRLRHVALETVLERAKHRKNRLVPEHVVRSIYTGSKEGLRKLYDDNREGDLFEDLDTIQEGAGNTVISGSGITT